jgi:hypothetical protein
MNNPKRVLVALAVAAALPLASTASADPYVDRDGIYAETTGARVTGTLDWLNTAGYVQFWATISDTRADGACADLYRRERNITGNSGWKYVGHACGSGTSTPVYYYDNSPFPGGTSGYDFKIVRSEYNNSAVDLNALLGD